ncbi:cytochrome-c peroxidase [Rhodobacteraceae bacterium CCMM004]|nr:cytochrome-c peroxidase [Rhodobacteraceae bacterium CCMM004]
MVGFANKSGGSRRHSDIINALWASSDNPLSAACARSCRSTVPAALHRLLGAAAALVLGLGAAAADPPPLPAPVGADAYRPVRAEAAALGRLLFWDPILSGNRNISCGTCHHPRFGTGDGLALGLGEGGAGLGPDRRVDPANPPEQRIPRNAPALFNLGAHEFTVMFHDGRVEEDPDRPSGMRTPMDDDMLAGFDGVLSAQTMFPVLSQDEMAGHYSENEIAQAVRMGRITGPGGAWDLLSRRVAAIPAYAEAFAALEPEIAAGRPIAFTDISNVIADFIAWEWRSDRSPFDAHLRGTVPLTGAAARGMDLFYGRAGCADCHAGPFQTDHGFHAMGVPQIGPGKGARFETHRRDEGRMRVTGRAEDAYAFRTPSLRNVTATAPYGHSGAFAELETFLRHHVDPAAPSVPDALLPPGVGAGDDLAVWGLPEVRDPVLGAVRRAPLTLTDAEIADLLAFLDSLTEPSAIAGRLGIPDTVPSGLSVDR